MAFVKKSLFLGASLLAMTNAFDGDGTFYGAGGNGDRGACMMTPGKNGVGVTVAMNHIQYDNGSVCGRCIKVTGRGEGGGATPIIGPIYASIDNECPECQYGDVDFGLSGDGRWRITWDFVDCNEARSGNSNLPGPKRTLRGLLESEEGKNYLAPGYMVTADGIKLISEVQAAQQQEQGQH